MKILLIYTARTGSTSIFNYFQKMKLEYECYNEPWFAWMINFVYEGKKIDYNDIIKKKNIFIKCTFKNLPTTIDNLVKDFDKIIILLRKNTKEQSESSILVNKERSYLDMSPRKYRTYNITDFELNDTISLYLDLNSKLKSISEEYQIPLFYYEDLYYNDFTPLFNELGLEYNSEYFKEHLDVSNKYRIGDLTKKDIKLLKKLI